MVMETYCQYCIDSDDSSCGGGDGSGDTLGDGRDNSGRGDNDSKVEVVKMTQQQLY